MCASFTLQTRTTMAVYRAALLSKHYIVALWCPRCVIQNIILLLDAIRAGCGALVVFSGSREIQNDRTGAVYTGRECIYLPMMLYYILYAHRLKICSIYSTVTAIYIPTVYK